MPYLAPYRHELRDIVAPFADALTTTSARSVGNRFSNVLDDIEALLDADAVPVRDAEEAYTTTVAACRDAPREVDDEALARGVAAATVATKTDILGALYQLAGRTEENYFNQYFTPPNVADALYGAGETTRTRFEPPEPTVENVSGQSALGMFSGNSTEPATDGGAVTTTDSDDGTVFFDPSCGSGRLLLAGARSTDDAVCLGWDIERTAVRMAALTLSLIEVPGWVVGGDALTMEVREVYRITAGDRTNPQHFRSIPPEDTPTLPDSRGGGTAEQGVSIRNLLRDDLQSPLTSGGECVTEIRDVLTRGVDQTVGNPPFDTCDLDQDARGPLPYGRFDTAHKSIGDQSAAGKGSQRYEWLFLEHALNYTRPSGAVSLVIPTSMLSKPSEAEEREWLLGQAFYDAGVELPPATFAPETTTGTSLVSFVPRDGDIEDVDVDYQIFIAVAEAVGHEADGTCLPYTDDAGDITLDVDLLPQYYQAHSWVGRDSVTQPDDDLYAILKNHREMREEDSATA